MRRIRQLAAVAVLLILLIGVPWALAVTIGNPLHGWSALKAGDLSDAVVIDILAGIVWAAIWVAWAQFVAAFVTAVREALQARAQSQVQGWPDLAGARVLEARVPGEFTGIPHLARWLVAAALLVGTAANIAAAAAQASADTPSSAPIAAIAQAHPQAPASTAAKVHAGTHASSTFASRQTGTRTYVVPADGSGPDTYWDIARAMLESGERWHEIWDLNRGRTQQDGSVMTQAGLLMPGWTVLVPAGTAAIDGEQIVPVVADDTLTQIAVDHDATEAAVWDANKGRTMSDGRTFSDPDLILPGDTIIIPAPAPAPAPAAHPQPNPHTPATSRPTPPPGPASIPPVTTPDTPASPTTPAPSTPGTPAPVQSTPSAAAPPADHARTQSSSEAPVLAFAAGGGLLLAGVALTALVAYRRRQWQYRQPGRTIANTEPDLVRMERAVLSAGRPAQADVTWLDQALRGLVQGVADMPGARLPDVIAVRVSADELELVLTGPAVSAPAPWQVSDDQTRWTISRSDKIPYNQQRRGYYFAPFPTLASVGYNAAGEHWLIDLERIAALSLTGDPHRCLNLARFLAAELAHNTWSEMLQVTLVGFGSELVGANPARLSYTDDLAGAVATVTRRYTDALDGMSDMDTTVLEGRLHDIVGDLWAPNVLLIAPRLADDRSGLEQLLEAMKAQSTRTTVALVLADDPDRAEASRWRMNVDEFGRLTIPALGLELVAEQIPAEEAAQLAQMLALAAVPADEPIPAGTGGQPWDEYADASGGLTIAAPEPVAPAAPPRFTPGSVPVLHPAPAAPWRDSVLPLSPQTYLDKAATTEQDLRALAPLVDDDIRAKLEQADPHLDKHLAAWHNPDCPRPRITLLGNVKVRAQGSLTGQERLHTEATVYLATRPKSGVLSTVFAQMMWPNDPDIVGKPVVRTTAAALRKWLGTDPVTGRHYLPADLREGRTARYCIQCALVDAELFRRLRIRGLGRGAEGIGDLWAALDLVEGPPFHELPMPDLNLNGEPLGPGGWVWLTDANVNLENVYASMVVDTAHTVADYHLGAGEPELAAKAAQVALRIGSYGDVPLLDLVCACMAMDKKAEAEAYVQQLMHNHDAEVEEDLPPRTAEMLFRLRRQWSERAS